MKNKKLKPDEITFEVIEYLGSLKESDKHDWVKSISRISWNESPATIDIRSLNMAKNKAGKGLSLTDEETDVLTNILLENDYGDIEVLKKSLEKRKHRFTISENDIENCFDEEEKLIINISM